MLGLEHPDTLASMDNLLSTYRDQGRWLEASKILTQAVATNRNVLGISHPLTKDVMSMLKDLRLARVQVAQISSKAWAPASGQLQAEHIKRRRF